MKIRNKVSSLLLALCLVCSATTPVHATMDYSYSITNQKHSLSVDDYRNWVTSQIKTKNSNNNEAQAFLNEFDNLTQEQQELFVSYISDPNLISEILNSISSNGTSYKSLKNGDVIISYEQDFKNNEDTVSTRAGMQYRIGTGTMTTYLLGIKIFEYSGEIRYNHNGHYVTEIPHANIWVSVNWFPFTSFSWESESTYGVGTSTAHHIKYCVWSIIHQSLGLTYSTEQIEITGNVYNYTTFNVRS